jgi:hypothetical protein
MFNTDKQKSLASDIHSELKAREMVCVFGRENGKTRALDTLFESIVTNDSGKLVLYPRRNVLESPDGLVFIRDLAIPRPDAITVTNIKRQILAALGVKAGRYGYDVETAFRTTLLAFAKSGRTIVVQIDNIELHNWRLLTIIKHINELRAEGKQIGAAALLAGKYDARKFPQSFLKRCSRFEVSAKMSVAEVKAFIDSVAPGESKFFTAQALDIVLNEGTMTDKKRLVKNIVKERKALFMDEANAELVTAAIRRAA